MYEAWIRAADAVGMRDLSELKLRTATLALLVTSPGCEACAKVETEEWDRLCRSCERRGAPLVQWKCTGENERNAALNAGVDDVPAIVLITKDSMQVFDAESFR